MVPGSAAAGFWIIFLPRQSYKPVLKVLPSGARQPPHGAPQPMLKGGSFSTRCFALVGKLVLKPLQTGATALFSTSATGCKK
jgi:hypothetical protein